MDRITRNCFHKCIASYKDKELAVGEMTCTDRCVHKYMQATEKIAEVLKEFEMEAERKAKATEDANQLLTSGKK